MELIFQAFLFHLFTFHSTTLPYPTLGACHYVILDRQYTCYTMSYQKGIKLFRYFRIFNGLKSISSSPFNFPGVCIIGWGILLCYDDDDDGWQFEWVVGEAAISCWEIPSVRSFRSFSMSDLFQLISEYFED